MVGEAEIESNTVRIKVLGLGEKSDGDEVKREDMVPFIKELLQKNQ